MNKRLSDDLFEASALDGDIEFEKVNKEINERKRQEKTDDKSN